MISYLINPREEKIKWVLVWLLSLLCLKLLFCFWSDLLFFLFFLHELLIMTRVVKISHIFIFRARLRAGVSPRRRIVTRSPRTPAARLGPSGKRRRRPAGTTTTRRRSGPGRFCLPQTKTIKFLNSLSCPRFQKGMNRREKALAGKSRVSHSVHCPYYTDDKQEFWWVLTRNHIHQKILTIIWFIA